MPHYQDANGAVYWLEDGDEARPDLTPLTDTEAAEALLPSLAEAKARRLTEIEAQANAAFTAGFTVPSGPLAGKVLQVRNNNDRTNWLTSQASYSSAVAAGAGAVVAAMFRTANNETVTVSYADGLAALLAMAAWDKAIMVHSWALKDAIAAAADHVTLDAVNVAAGWP
jgi:hypothetical protein